MSMSVIMSVIAFALAGQPEACSAERAAALARGLAESRQCTPKRLRIAELIGPTGWAGFVKRKPEYRTIARVYKLVGDATFFYVEVAPEAEGKSVPIDGGGPRVVFGREWSFWVDAGSCEILQWLD